MVKIYAWISAARLRTLPLSVSGIIMGSALAYKEEHFNWKITVLALLTTLGFQILSNFANDYGDGVKGTDNHERVGPLRAMQSGVLTGSELIKGIIVCTVFTLILAIILIYVALGKEEFWTSFLFFILGLASIVAAIKYTVGQSAYGYRGMGDLFVFLFFGLLAVLGSYYLHNQYLKTAIILPAITIGLWSTAVLNLNNMRDRIPDGRAGKNTLAVLMGPARVKFYHFALILGGLLAIISYISFTNSWLWLGISMIVIIPFSIHLYKVYRNTEPALLDPELKKVAITTFAFSVLFSLGVALSF